jgi:hypothetical protein
LNRAGWAYPVKSDAKGEPSRQSHPFSWYFGLPACSNCFPSNKQLSSLERDRPRQPPSSTSLSNSNSQSLRSLHIHHNRLCHPNLIAPGDVCSISNNTNLHPRSINKAHPTTTISPLSRGTPPGHNLPTAYPHITAHQKIISKRNGPIVR